MPINRSFVKQSRKVTVKVKEFNDFLGTTRDGKDILFHINPDYQDSPEIGSRVTIESDGEGNWSMI